MADESVQTKTAGEGVVFATSIFLSALLLFAVQPLIARFILPWFGGAASVWTTCLLFFQALLLAGYAYAHLLADRFSPRAQAIVHVALLLSSIVALPIAPSPRLAPADPHFPTLRVLFLLTITVGLPYFAVSATSPLVQHWFARVYPGRSVYRLFALSNFGSLAALVSYPFLIEPLLTRRQQSIGWSALFVIFMIACAASAMIALRRGAAALPIEHELDPHPPLTGRAAIHVLLLTTLASALLLSVTNKICQDIAPFPFLWVLPLTLYLIAFIVCFEWPDRYRRGIVMPAAALATLASAYMIVARGRVPMTWQVVVLHLGLFTCCLFCLGETARLRPHARHLTRYYLLVALGGVIGAMLVALAAPAVFNLFLELHVCLVAAWCAGLAVLLLSRTSAMRGFRRPIAWLISIVAFTGLLAALYYDFTFTAPGRILARRNFYGVLEVIQSGDEDPRQTHRMIIHNGTVHGLQFMHPDLRRTPLSYYEPASGVGVVLRTFHADRSRRVGAIGLGAGCIAAYGKAGDHYTFYELDPDDIAIAQSHFTYLADNPATLRLVAGDGRLMLARESELQRFDVIVLDAFAGDAVPVHLLTVEAFDLYRRHLAPGGAIVINLSNKYLNLLPPTWSIAMHFNYAAAFLATAARGTYRSDWLVMSDDRAFIDLLASDPAYRTGRILKMNPWTDDHAPLFPLLRGSRR